MAFNFLENLVLTDTGNKRQPKQRNPEGLAIRIFSNGEVYPSEELVEKFNLEYPDKKDVDTSTACGFDIIDSTEWNPTKSLPRVLLLGLVPKVKAKLDLFALARYDEVGRPRASVLDQGTVSDSLLDLVRSLGYLKENEKYCDLVFDMAHPITIADGIAFVPKTIDKGPRKNEKTYERRENITVYHVAPAALLNATEQPTEEQIKITHT